MRKKTQVKRLNNVRKSFFGVITIVVAMSIFIIFIFNSSFFEIKKINIRNNNFLKKEDILKQSKLKINNNIFKFKISYVEDSLAKNPFIKSVNIKRELPDTINIEIVEREEAILFQYISMYLLVDEDGFIMEHLEKRDKKLPIVKGFYAKSIGVSENIFSEEENKNLNIFVKEAKTLNLLADMDEIDKEFSNDVNILLKNGIFVAFGTLNNVEYKLSLLKEILKDVEKKEIKTNKIIMNKGKHPILILDE